MTAKPVIAIDPGHNCPPDIGASATVNGVIGKEDVIVLAIANELKDLCAKSGIRTIWCLPSKATDVPDSLRQRVRLSNQGGATLYLSLHCNVYTPTSAARGAEAYAVSSSGKALAQDLLAQLAKLGFKTDRGVKTNLGNSPPFVVNNTNAVAVLLELCFLDSVADREVLAKNSPQAIAQAILTAILGEEYDDDPQTPQTPQYPIPRSPLSQSCLAAILENPGSTSGLDGISDQLIKRMDTTKLVRFIAPNFYPGENCDPYFQPHFAEKLKTALAAHPGERLDCNSAFRSFARQAALHECYRRGIGGISLAAVPGGSSPHSNGVAIDVKQWQRWKPWLEDVGLDWQGSDDVWHFDCYSAIPGLARAGVLVFQTLWNENNPNEKLLEDGLYGDKTRQAFLRAPAHGWQTNDPTTARIYSRALKQGMQGADVELMARRLRNLGYYKVAIEHQRFESLLGSELRRFQLDRGLVSDGIAGRSTLEELFGDTSSPFDQFIKGTTNG